MLSTSTSSFFLFSILEINNISIIPFKSQLDNKGNIENQFDEVYIDKIETSATNILRGREAGDIDFATPLYIYTPTTTTIIIKKNMVLERKYHIDQISCF